MTTSPVVEMRDITVGFPGVKALDGVAFGKAVESGVRAAEAVLETLRERERSAPAE